MADSKTKSIPLNVNLKLIAVDGEPLDITKHHYSQLVKHYVTGRLHTPRHFFFTPGHCLLRGSTGLPGTSSTSTSARGVVPESGRPPGCCLRPRHCPRAPPFAPPPPCSDAPSTTWWRQQRPWTGRTPPQQPPTPPTPRPSGAGSAAPRTGIFFFREWMQRNHAKGVDSRQLQLQGRGQALHPHTPTGCGAAH